MKILLPEHTIHDACGCKTLTFLVRDDKWGVASEHEYEELIPCDTCKERGIRLAKICVSLYDHAIETGCTEDMSDAEEALRSFYHMYTMRPTSFLEKYA